MATFTTYVKLDTRTLDLYKDYENASFTNRQPGSFTVDLPDDYYVNIVGTGFKYKESFGFYYPSEGTTTAATLYEGTKTLAVLSDVAITMQQAGQYQSQDALTVSKAVFAGADTITGSIYDDYLDGFGGADALYGGKGSDTYVISQAGDKAYEKVGEGTKDLVMASVSYSLAGQDIENLTLTGTGKIGATGNGLDNVITGNGAENVLTGGGGHDTFAFKNAIKTTNVDHIADFKYVDDSIQLAKSIFKGLTADATTHEITRTEFKDITNPKTALDGDDHILYDRSTGALYYDADGSGSGVKMQFATLDANSAGQRPSLTYHDILVV